MNISLMLCLLLLFIKRTFQQNSGPISGILPQINIGPPPRTEAERDVTVSDMRNQIRNSKRELHRALAEIKEIRGRQIPGLVRHLKQVVVSGGTKSEIRAAREPIWEARRMVGELVSIKYDSRERVEVLRNAIKQLKPLIFE